MGTRRWPRSSATTKSEPSEWPSSSPPICLKLLYIFITYPKLNADHQYFNRRRHFFEKKDVCSHQNERNYRLLPIKLYVFQNQKYTLLLICLIFLNSHTTYTFEKIKKTIFEIQNDLKFPPKKKKKKKKRFLKKKKILNSPQKKKKKKKKK